MDFDFNELDVFATDELVERTVSLMDKGEPVEGVVHIKRLPSVEIDRFTREASHADVDVSVQAIPRLLSKAVRKADGKAQFTSEKAGKLTNFNRSALLNAVMEVNKRVSSEDRKRIAHKGGAWFRFVLAGYLGKTLAEIGQMTLAEIDAWREFHLVNPIDDHHRIYRPAALMASAFVSGKDRQEAVQGYLDWLEPKPVIFNEIDKRTLAAFGLKHPRS